MGAHLLLVRAATTPTALPPAGKTQRQPNFHLSSVLVYGESVRNCASEGEHPGLPVCQWEPATACTAFPASPPTPHESLPHMRRGVFANYRGSQQGAVRVIALVPLSTVPGMPAPSTLNYYWSDAMTWGLPRGASPFVLLLRGPLRLPCTPPCKCVAHYRPMAQDRPSTGPVVILQHETNG